MRNMRQKQTKNFFPSNMKKKSKKIKINKQIKRLKIKTWGRVWGPNRKERLGRGKGVKIRFSCLPRAKNSLFAWFI